MDEWLDVAFILKLETGLYNLINAENEIKINYLHAGFNCLQYLFETFLHKIIGKVIQIKIFILIYNDRKNENRIKFNAL